MTIEVIMAGLLAGFWGIVWACTLQLTPWGRWAAVKRTWLTVVIGVAGTLLCALVVLPWQAVLTFVYLFGASGIPIIVRSLFNEWNQDL